LVIQEEDKKPIALEGTNTVSKSQKKLPFYNRFKYIKKRIEIKYRGVIDKWLKGNYSGILC
jgi:hypothetical protein